MVVRFQSFLKYCKIKELLMVIWNSTQMLVILLKTNVLIKLIPSIRILIIYLVTRYIFTFSTGQTTFLFYDPSFRNSKQKIIVELATLCIERGKRGNAQRRAAHTHLEVEKPVGWVRAAQEGRPPRQCPCRVRRNSTRERYSTRDNFSANATQ